MQASCKFRHAPPLLRFCSTILETEISFLTKMTEQEETNAISSEIITDLGFATPEKQQARAFLRERFLRIVTGIVGKQTKFHLHENTCVSGEFRGCDIEFLEIFVRNLETPMGKIPEAILRNGDIIHLDIDDINIEQ